MKRYVGIIIVLYITVFLLSACSKETIVNFKLGVDFTGGDVIRNEDTHGGFHGDGHTFTMIQYQGKKAEEIITQIQDSDLWRPLPLSDTLSIAVYGNQYYQSLVLADDGIPFITEGYYYFKDRNSESKDSSNEVDLFHRGSFNFDIAIYDVKENILYFYRLDT